MCGGDFFKWILQKRPFARAKGLPTMKNVTFIAFLVHDV